MGWFLFLLCAGSSVFSRHFLRRCDWGAKLSMNFVLTYLSRCYQGWSCRKKLENLLRQSTTTWLRPLFWGHFQMALPCPKSLSSRYFTRPTRRSGTGHHEQGIPSNKVITDSLNPALTGRRILSAMEPRLEAKRCPAFHGEQRPGDDGWYSAASNWASPGGCIQARVFLKLPLVVDFHKDQSSTFI